MLAQQSLQADFDPNLVRMFDKHAQGALAQSVASAGRRIHAVDRRRHRRACRRSLSHHAFGFADFVSGGGDSAVRVARPVAVAETGRAGDQTAIVRLRQNGEDKLSLQLYRVDDLDGTIGTLHPGDAGYEAAAAARAYLRTAPAARTIDGPGYGNDVQAAAAARQRRRPDRQRSSPMPAAAPCSGAFSQANEILPGQRSRRASVELRAECLGLGRHQKAVATTTIMT